MNRTLSSKQICLEEKDIIKEGMKIKLVDCIHCDNKFYIIKEFKSKIVTCPKCKNTEKIKCYKNGNSRISADIST